jgi:hypothetical protein
MRQAITTRWLGVTTYKPIRIAAFCAAKRIYVSYEYGYSADINHLLAAQKLAELLGWKGVWHSGQMSNGDYAHVMVDGDHSFTSIGRD